jgi:hypothetical protein
VAEHLDRTVCASALALYDILGYPDGRQVGALSMEKLDTMYRPQRKTVGYRVDSRSLSVGLLQYKRDQAADIITPWLTMPKYTLLDAAILCGNLESTSTCNRWIRPYFFAIQNTIRADLTAAWKRIQGYYIRLGIDKIKAKYRLPKNLERRLAPLIAKDKAKLLWHSKATFDIPNHVKKGLLYLQTSLRDTSVKWEKSIAHWIQRDPTFVAAGDASQVAGGGLCEELEYWFDVQWTDRVQRGCKLKSTDPGYIHINMLEYVVVLIQLAASIVALETGYAKKMLGATLPTIPHLLVWTDNKVSKSWSNRVTSTSQSAQPLLGIQSALLQRSNIGFGSDHVAGEDNDGPDFISRPGRAPKPALTHFDRSLQIITNDKRLKSWHYFRPSVEFTSLVESMLFTEHWVDPPNLPKTLGRFEHGVSTGSLFVRI